MSDEQDPEFGWLYGGKGRAAGGQTPPEATRAIRVQPRSPQSSGGRTAGPAGGPAGRPSGAPPSAPPPASRGTEYGGSRGPRLRRPRLRTVLLVLLALVVVWVGSLVWIGLATPKSLTRVDWEPTAGTRPADQPGSTYLVVGSDSRAGLTARQRRRLHTGGDVGQRTDTIKLLHTGSGPNVLLTIPRDSYVPVPGHGSSKINAAFAWGGPELLVQTIEADTGLRIDGYVEIGMGGLVRLVNGVGGVTICPTSDMDDPLANLHVKKGCQHAWGVKALAYARSRHAQKLGDLGRGEAQSEVIGQIGEKVTTVSLLANPFKLNRLKSHVNGIIVGKGMSTMDIAKFALAFKSVSNGTAKQCGIPISDMFIHWDKAKATKLLGYLKRDDSANIPKGLCTPSGLPRSVTG